MDGVHNNEPLSIPAFPCHVGRQGKASQHIKFVMTVNDTLKCMCNKHQTSEGPHSFASLAFYVANTSLSLAFPKVHKNKFLILKQLVSN